MQFAYPGDVASNGTQLLGNFNQLYKLKQQNRNLKTILSVGGWSYRENFKTALATNATRYRFAESSLKLIADLGLDGFDIGKLFFPSLFSHQRRASTWLLVFRESISY